MKKHISVIVKQNENIPITIEGMECKISYHTGMLADSITISGDQLDFRYVPSRQEIYVAHFPLNAEISFVNSSERYTCWSYKVEVNQPEKFIFMKAHEEKNWEQIKADMTEERPDEVLQDIMTWREILTEAFDVFNKLNVKQQ